MQKAENLPPADFQVNIFRKVEKSNALTKRYEFPPILWNFPLALLGCYNVFACLRYGLSKIVSNLYSVEDCRENFHQKEFFQNDNVSVKMRLDIDVEKHALLRFELVEKNIFVKVSMIINFI